MIAAIETFTDEVNRGEFRNSEEALRTMRSRIGSLMAPKRQSSTEEQPTGAPLIEPQGDEQKHAVRLAPNTAVIHSLPKKTSSTIVSSPVP